VFIICIFIIIIYLGCTELFFRSFHL